MRFRKLRIAWSVAWGLVCLLLVWMWVRSQTTRDLISWGAAPLEPGYKLESRPGEFGAVRLPYSQGLVAPGWHRWSVSYRWSAFYRRYMWRGFPRESGHEWYPSGRPKWLGFRINLFDTRMYYVIAPYWFPILSSGAFAVLPWIRQVRWRFSLRALLIATTMFAVVLGLIIYAVRN
jgi:hypothetical protein